MPELVENKEPPINASIKNINEKLKNWVQEVFKKNSFNMIDVSSKKETFRRAQRKNLKGI